MSDLCGSGSTALDPGKGGGDIERYRYFENSLKIFFLVDLPGTICTRTTFRFFRHKTYCIQFQITTISKISSTVTEVPNWPILNLIFRDAPDTVFAGYPANPKAGYRISGRISSEGRIPDIRPDTGYLTWQLYFWLNNKYIFKNSVNIKLLQTLNNA
jgi:hypothetical protein